MGRAVGGSAELVRDIVTSGASVLLLGRPGVGKTTAIREISRMLSDEVRLQGGRLAGRATAELQSPSLALRFIPLSSLSLFLTFSPLVLQHCSANAGWSS